MITQACIGAGNQYFFQIIFWSCKANQLGLDHNNAPNALFLSPHIMKRLLYLLGFLGILIACKDESHIDQEFLSGKWIVQQAFRNEKLTNTLEGAFFYFDGTIMTSNFMGVEQQANYLLERNILKLTKGLDYTFHLKKLGVQQLELKVEIQKTLFVFKLKKE